MSREFGNVNFRREPQFRPNQDISEEFEEYSRPIFMPQDGRYMRNNSEFMFPRAPQAQMYQPYQRGNGGGAGWAVLAGAVGLFFGSGLLGKFLGLFHHKSAQAQISAQLPQTQQQQPDGAQRQQPDTTQHQQNGGAQPAPPAQNNGPVGRNTPNPELHTTPQQQQQQQPHVDPIPVTDAKTARAVAAKDAETYGITVGENDTAEQIQAKIKAVTVDEKRDAHGVLTHNTIKSTDGKLTTVNDFDPTGKKIITRTATKTDGTSIVDNFDPNTGVKTKSTQTEQGGHKYIMDYDPSTEEMTRRTEIWSDEDLNIDDFDKNGKTTRSTIKRKNQKDDVTDYVYNDAGVQIRSTETKPDGSLIVIVRDTQTGKPLSMNKTIGNKTTLYKPNEKDNKGIEPWVPVTPAQQQRGEGRSITNPDGSVDNIRNGKVYKRTFVAPDGHHDIYEGFDASGNWTGTKTVVNAQGDEITKFNHDENHVITDTLIYKNENRSIVYGNYKDGNPTKRIDVNPDGTQTISEPNGNGGWRISSTPTQHAAQQSAQGDGSGFLISNPFKNGEGNQQVNETKNGKLYKTTIQKTDGTVDIYENPDDNGHFTKKTVSKDGVTLIYQNDKLTQKEEIKRNNEVGNYEKVITKYDANGEQVSQKTINLGYN